MVSAAIELDQYFILKYLCRNRPQILSMGSIVNYNYPCGALFMFIPLCRYDLCGVMRSDCMLLYCHH